MTDLARERAAKVRDIIKHYDNCRPDYPEKTPGEAPRATTDIELDNGCIARTCNDCGAFVILDRK